jgi:uncharacterized integral membrane protein
MRWLLFLPLLLLLSLFALSNTEEVSFRLWPLAETWSAPLGIAVLVLAALGFLTGTLVTWAAGLRARRRAAEVTQAARLLEAELADLRARQEAARKAADLGRLQQPALVP